jgi:hypothetical protein
MIREVILKGLEGSSRGLIEVLSPRFSGETEENHENSFGVATVRVEIQTDHLPNTTQRAFFILGYDTI